MPPIIGAGTAMSFIGKSAAGGVISGAAQDCLGMGKDKKEHKAQEEGSPLPPPLDKILGGLAAMPGGDILKTMLSKHDEKSA